MKRLLFGLAMVVVALARPAAAAELDFSSFNSDITVQTNASIAVVETITAEFSTPHHGIFRTIPYRFLTTGSDEAAIPITIEGVEQDGGSATYTTDDDGTNITLKIGQANKTITGRHLYTIRYTAQAAANFFPDHDELYWNATGTTWDAPLSNITTTVHLPATFTSETITTACYTGAYGSTAKNCTQSHTDTTATFTSNDYLTVVVGWPVGTVIKPADYDALRTAGPTFDTTPNPALQPPSALVLTVNIVFVIIIFGLMYMRWLKNGRDPAKRKTVIAQYDPPDDFRPAELYAVMHEDTPMKHLLPATMVDLAVRGYIHIREVNKDKLLGLAREKDYELVRIKPADEQLRPFERAIMGVLFDAKYIDTQTQPVVRLSELKKRKYTANPFSPAMSQVMGRVVRKGYFTGSPMTAKVIVGVFGVLLIGAAALLIGGGVFAWGGVLAGLLTFGFIPAMPQRSVKGAEAAWVGQGFRLFIEKAEQYRVKWQERENIFERFLPYAMVFGLADKWSKALADVAKQPDWYTGSSNQMFNSMVFLSAMNSFSSSANAAVVSAAASGSSGLGGGGFSGGGGGGGGGGGW